MQNILLIGNLNTTLSSIYKSLLQEYRVQLCKVAVEDVEGMVKIVEPDLCLISMYGVDYFDVQIMEVLRNLEDRIPVIFIGTFEECREYIHRYDDSLFSFVERPVTQPVLLEKCREMLNWSDHKKELLNPEKVKRRILVVDDSGVFLRTMKTLLEPKYEAVLAKSGEKALVIALEEHIDLILLDYEMPGLNGKETLEKLQAKESTKDIPVIFLTSVSDKNHILEVLKLQPQGYILKPVDGEELEKKIIEVLDRMDV